MADLELLTRDLHIEHVELDLLLAELRDSEWDRETPAEDWTIRDQVGHLAFFDEQARTAVAEPEAFMHGLEAAAADIAAFTNNPLEKGRAMTPAEVLGWWRNARSQMLASFEGLESKQRVPWFGPPMSSSSFVTARLMETWAHGQDVFDALGRDREPTDRLRHVAFLGVRARPYSYIMNGLEAPTDEVRVELRAPGGQTWVFGDSQIESVRGSALDFCLVVTQRRHLDDTDLEVEGPSAAKWMSIAQAFAGPPGKGRIAGQFPSSH
jgi:uncharacterized protein (TIGR03084 family)